MLGHGLDNKFKEEPGELQPEDAKVGQSCSYI